MYWLTGILGLLLMFAPYLFGYQTNFSAFWTSIAIGFVVAGASLIEGFRHDRENWEYWLAGILGVFAIISPFIFGFNTHAIALWSTTSIGLLIVAIAASRLLVGSSR